MTEQQILQPYRVKGKLFVDCPECGASLPVSPHGGTVQCHVCQTESIAAKYVNRGEGNGKS